MTDAERSARYSQAAKRGASMRRAKRARELTASDEAAFAETQRICRSWADEEIRARLEERQARGH